ncbi:MAG: SusC/RagA family TonB-linked outer membrane protein [Mucilaginibacter sp.]
MMKDVLSVKLNKLRGAILAILLVISVNAFAQTVAVSGRVTSSQDGTTLAGVSVRIKGTSQGTVTDVNGNYRIQASPGAVLQFNYIGYLPQEITVGADKAINIKLSPDAKTLVEVNVVSIGYGTAKRADVTGAVGSINAATIAKVPVTTIDQSLQGRVAGVQVTNNDASPGGNVTVLIRGTGSLAPNGSAPLYVVDGYPLETGGINNINPNDIATIDVLKDASATAIYGIRAANGVVIITTKRGRKDGTQVTLDAYNAFQSKPKEYKVLNADQFATLADAQAANDPAKSFTVLPQWNNPSSLTEADWQNAIYREGLTQSYTLGIRGGNEKVQSGTSVGYYDQKGIVLGSYFKRLTLNSNADYQPTHWLKSSTNVKYTYQDANNPFGTGSLGQLAQLPPTLDGGNKTTSQIQDGSNYGFFNPIYTYVAKYSNPVYSIESNRYSNISQFFIANSSLEATLLPGLRIKTNAGATVTNYNGSYFSPEDDRLVNQYGSQAGATQNALYSQSTNNSFDWLWENTIAYDRTFGKHTINFVAGVSEQKVTYNQFSGSGVPPNGVIRDISQVTNLQLGSSAQQIQALASQFARLNYNYAGKYYITGTIRRDGSSKFAPGHQYGVFPSGAVKWKAKQEDFLKNVDWLTDLNFRGSYGELGNQGPVTPFAYDALYSSGLPATNSGNGGYPFGKSGSTAGTYQGGIVATQPPNPNLKWETDYETDIGTDMAFLHGDLTLTVDWFNRKSKDFLLNVAVPPQTGYTTEPQNVGSMTNKGWEFAVNYNHHIGDFKYGVGLSVSAIRNTLTSLNSGATTYTNPQNSPAGAVNLNGQGWGIYSVTNIGQGVGEFYGYKFAGIIQSQAQIDALNANAKNKSNGVYQYYYMAATGPGDRLFADLNGDGVVTASDETSLGSPQPKFFGGLNLDGAYKNWDITLYFYGTYGNKILNYEESNLETFQNRGFVGIENISQQYYANAWTPSNPSNLYPRIYYNDNSYGNSVPSSAWIQNGSFLKLKTVNIGYTFSNDFIRKLSLSKVRVYVSSQNLFTVTSYKGLDPEIGTQGGYATQNGIDNGTYPSSRFYTVGLNVTF